MVGAFGGLQYQKWVSGEGWSQEEESKAQNGVQGLSILAFSAGGAEAGAVAVELEVDTCNGGDRLFPFSKAGSGIWKEGQNSARSTFGLFKII